MRVNLLHDPSILIICGIVVLGAALPSLLEPTLPLHLRARFGTSPVVIGLLFGVPTLAYGISAPLVGVLAGRLSRTALIVAGLQPTPLVLPLLALAQLLLIECIVLFLLGVTLGLVMTPTLPALSDVVDRHGGVAYGVVYALYNLA